MMTQKDLVRPLLAAPLFLSAAFFAVPVSASEDSLPGAIFFLPSGWDVVAPTTAKQVTATSTKADTGYINDGTLSQTLDGSVAIVANVIDGTVNGPIIGGHPYDSQTRTLSNDIWIKVSGGSHRVVVGGNDAQNYSAGGHAVDANSYINLSGGTVAYAFSGNFMDGRDVSVNGRRAVVIDGDAVLTGSAGVGQNIHGHPVTYNNADLNVTVRNLQNTNTAGKCIGIAPGWTGDVPNATGYLIGGGFVVRSNSSRHVVNGKTSVCVELPEGTEGRFSKTLIGGHAVLSGGTSESSVSGTSSVSVTAPNAVIFDRDIVGGSHTATSASAPVGISAVTLTGGTYTGTIIAGGRGGNARTSGDATLTLDGGDYSAATLQPGNVRGVSRLVLRKSAAPGTLGSFDEISSENGATLALPAGTADLSATRGTFTLDAFNVSTLTVNSMAELTFTALPAAGFSVAVPEGEPRCIVCTVPEGSNLSGMTFTVDGETVAPVLEGTTLTLKPVVSGPFAATVAEDTSWRALRWLNADGREAVSFEEAFAAGVTLRATETATVTLDSDFTNAAALTVDIVEGKTLTIAGQGKLNFSSVVSGALTLSEKAYASKVTLPVSTDSLTLDLGTGSQKHDNMIGAIAGAGTLYVRASGGNWDAGTSTDSRLFNSALNVSALSGPVVLGDGLRDIRCSPSTFSSLKRIVLGKGVQLRQLDTANASYALVASSGAHLQDGSWGSEGCGLLRTGYTVNLNGALSGSSVEGEPPALVNAYAGTGNVHFNGKVTGDGLATGSWGSGESRAMNYYLHNAANDFRLLLIRNMKLSQASQVGCTIANTTAGALGKSAVTFGTERNVANCSTLSLAASDTVASVTAQNGGNIKLGAGVTLTVEGDANLSGLTMLEVTLPADYDGTPFFPLTARTLSLDSEKVKLLSSRMDLSSTIVDGMLRIEAVTFAEGVDAGLGSSAQTLATQAALDAGVATVTKVQTKSSAGVTTNDAAAVNGVAECFANIPVTCDGAGVVTLTYDFGITAVKPSATVADSFDVTVCVQGAESTVIAPGVQVTLTDIDGNAISGLPPPVPTDGSAAEVTLTVSAEALAAQPFKAKASLVTAP